jgi:hypothetical protein
MTEGPGAVELQRQIVSLERRLNSVQTKLSALKERASRLKTGPRPDPVQLSATTESQMHRRLR